MIDKQNTTIVLDIAELTCLMKARSVTSVSHLGFDETTNLSNQELQIARDQLHTAGLLSSNGQITGENLPMLDALFFPERSLTAILDIPNRGRQALLLLNRQGITLLYTKPDEKSYRLELFSQPEQVSAFLKNVFPFGESAVGEPFAVPTSLLESLPHLVAARDIARAKQTLDALQCAQAEKDALLLTLQNKKISGSMLALDLDDGGQALDGFSLAILADSQSLWLFSQSTPDDKALIAQRNGALFFHILDIFSQRLLAGGAMIDSPLDKNKIVSFSLTASEFAFCFVHNNRKDVALTILNSNFPDESSISTQFDRLMTEARVSLLARGWMKINQDGTVLLAQKLASAISAVAGYDYVLQLNIVRPNLSASGTIHVIKNRLFTAVLRPGQDIYVVEYGDISMLPTYISKLFLDFSQTDLQIDVREEKITYPQLVDAMGKNDMTLSAKILTGAGVVPETANLLAQDLLHNLYQGSIVRINLDSHASQEEINGSVKPLLLLLRGQQRSWVYRFTPTEDQGYLILMRNLDAFLGQLTDFTAN